MDGWCVRVDNLTRGSNESQFNLVFGKLDQLFFDLARWWWLEVFILFYFYAFSAKEGRKWITKQVALKKPFPHNEIPPSTSPK